LFASLLLNFRYPEFADKKPLKQDMKISNLNNFIYL
jgi:hypothetical protein